MGFTVLPVMVVSMLALRYTFMGGGQQARE